MQKGVCSHEGRPPQHSRATSSAASTGMVERNWYLIKRYAWWEIAFFFWSLANTLTIVFIAKGSRRDGGQIDINRRRRRC